MYGTSKRGLTQFVRGLALAGAPHNVRALCVAPGPVLTRPGMAAMQTPLGRAADPIEVVDFILSLCSDKSSFITGSTHFIDGGYLSR
jgi:NAD(P)-dependent dehydrogenase (short-subunit alcohol dehydrogenase family)